MELKNSSKGSKPSGEDIDIEALDNLIDEYGESLDPENNSPRAVEPVDNSLPAMRMVSPVKSMGFTSFEPKDYAISELRVFIVDQGLKETKASDLICFELKRQADGIKQKIFYSPSNDKFYQL